MDHETLMARAIELAREAADRGNVAVGSVLAKDGAVLSEGINRAADTGDPLVHAETEALHAAMQAHGAAAVAGSTCVTTMEPCPMCAGALIVAGVSTVVLGARFAQIAPERHGGYAIERLAAHLAAPLEVVTGVRIEECLALRRIR